MLILVLRDQSLYWAGTEPSSINATYLLCLVFIKASGGGFEGVCDFGPWGLCRLLGCCSAGSHQAAGECGAGRTRKPLTTTYKSKLVLLVAKLILAEVEACKSTLCFAGLRQPRGTVHSQKGKQSE